MVPILIYISIGWALATLAHFSAGQHMPDRPDAPKWATVLTIVMVWPLLLYLVWKDKR